MINNKAIFSSSFALLISEIEVSEAVGLSYAWDKGEDVDCSIGHLVFLPIPKKCSMVRIRHPSNMDSIENSELIDEINKQKFAYIARLILLATRLIRDCTVVGLLFLSEW